MNEATIWRYFKGKGFSDCGTAGLMGNLFAESALNPRNLQNSFEASLSMNDNAYTAAVDNGTYTNFVRDKAGYGLAQWTYWSRKQNLLDFARARGASIGDLDMQLDFLYQELCGYKGMVEALKTAASVLEASNLVLLNYEKPANKSASVQQKRAEYGQRYYDQFAAGTKTVAVSGMKYTDRRPPAVCMMTQSTCYKGTRKMQVNGVLWHSTGANNPWLKRYVQPSDNDPKRAELLNLLGRNSGGNDWNHVKVEAGVNCWIGKLLGGTVAAVQTMPWDYRPWGCGKGRKGSCNNGWIQFEICEDSLTDQGYFDKVYQEACEITAYLCRMYGIDPHGTVNVGGVNIPTILCHADSYTLGFGSNHGDVNHWFSRFGKSMASARDDVAALMRAGSAQNVQPVLTVNTETEDDDMDVVRFTELWREMRKSLQDNDAGEWSKEARQWAVRSGLIAGSGTTIDGAPNCMWQDVLTREQMAQIMYRFAQMMGKA